MGEELTIEEIRSRLEAAMETGPVPDWLDEACDRLARHRRSQTRERVYDVSTIGARIRTAREVVGYTQRQLANRCGIFPPRMSGIERGRSDLEARFIPVLCTALGVTRAWMLMESDEGGPAIPERVMRKLRHVGWNEESRLVKNKARARAELERLRGLRPPLPTRVAVVDGDPSSSDPAP